MKIALLSILTILSFSACKKTYINQTVNQVFSATYTIAANQWTASNSGKIQTASLSVPELDQIIQTTGGVEIYLSFDNGTTFEAVPEVVDGLAYGAYYSVGTVSIDLQDVQNNVVTPPPGTILAKVVLLDGVPL